MRLGRTILMLTALEKEGEHVAESGADGDEPEVVDTRYKG
jgi:hypothetical protein